MKNILSFVSGFFINILLPIFVLGLLFYFVVETRNTNDSSNKQKTTIDNELQHVYDKLSYIDKQLKNNINEKAINIRNCKGIFEDNDKDNYYDKLSFLNHTISKENRITNSKYKPKYTIYYNFCSYNFSKNNNYTLIGTTDFLLKNVKKVGDNPAEEQEVFLSYELKGDNKHDIPLIKKVYAPLDIILK